LGVSAQAVGMPRAKVALPATAPVAVKKSRRRTFASA